MAFDYPNLKEYSLDIDELRNYIYKHFHLDFEYFDQWIDGWMKVLKSCEKDTDKQVNSLKENGFPMFEVFLQEMHFGGVTFKFNFIIDGAKDYVKTTQPKPKKMKASQFSKDIKWSRMQDDPKSELNNPILLATFPVENYMSVVIDGNHRLTKLLEKGEREVDYIHINPMDIINHNILLFTIDKAMYAFIIEAKVFQQHLEKGTPHKDLIESSNINNGFKEFNID
ncbi:hypothetical protein [Priestia endophytica]|uniref:ParB/Sulfiredoxin domain-containing protein n=1 Tax=Priestia endophytica DSM 13796 TaxID=1121089 RepID=A0A1I6C028_9BACI|nr:hypothetical protein [Priestia endophytica]KYG33461.1 hypothetical protein AZF06_21695 [Priestia endophytica]SFQ86536.1 hypothetical protein SAMN02745910_04663 [Priestia endophytica DSM 13796]